MRGGPVIREARAYPPHQGRAVATRRFPGAVGFGLTSNRKVRLVPPVPSLTVMVMSANPVWAGRGVTAKVRLLSVPPKTMSVFRTSAGFDELAVMVRLDALVSGSLMVKGMAAVAESIAMT